MPTTIGNVRPRFSGESTPINPRVIGQMATITPTDAPPARDVPFTPSSFDQQPARFNGKGGRPGKKVILLDPVGGKPAGTELTLRAAADLVADTSGTGCTPAQLRYYLNPPKSVNGVGSCMGIRFRWADPSSSASRPSTARAG